MGVRSLLDAERAVLAILVVGIASFSLVHSASLLQAGGDRTLSLFRGLWFAGLVITTFLLVAASALGE